MVFPSFLREAVPVRSHPSIRSSLEAEADRATKSSWSKRLGHELADARAKQQEVRRRRGAAMLAWAIVGLWAVSADLARLGKFKSSRLMNYVKHVDAWISWSGEALFVFA